MKIFVLANNILVMKMPDLTKNQKIFIGSIINLLPYGGYSGYPKKSTLKNDTIILPTINGAIDYDFMESFIADLEQERMQTLQAYLQASGLDNYELTDIEERALNEFTNIQWGTFRIGNLFDRVKTKKLPYKAEELSKEPIGAYTLPCLTSSFKNQGP